MITRTLNQHHEHEHGQSNKEHERERERDPPRSQRNTCPECDGTIRHNEPRGERVCENCGLVTETRGIDYGPDQRMYNAEDYETKARTGAPLTVLRHDRGLTTEIDWKNEDANGNAIPEAKRAQLARIREWDKRAKANSSQDRSLRHGLGEIMRMSSALGTPDSTEKIAAKLYRECVEQDMLTGHSIEGIATAALYTATRMQTAPISITEIETVSRVDERSISRDYNYIREELGLNFAPPDPMDFVQRTIGGLSGVSSDVEQYAVRIVQEAKEVNVHNGTKPSGIAAAAVYMAAKITGDPVSQHDVADAANVTTVTLRKRMQEIIERGDESWINPDTHQ